MTDLSSNSSLDRPECWPSLSPRFLARYLRHAAHVDADRGQDSHAHDAAGQSLVERSLYVNARGLTTSRIPCGDRAFELRSTLSRITGAGS